MNNYENIKTWEDACKVNNVDPNKLPDVSMIPEKFQNWIINTYKIGIITEAINTDKDGKIWTPNWNDSDEYKYQPWFEIEADNNNPQGSGFSGAGYGDWYTATSVGSRLCFQSKEQVKHVQKYFEDVFIEMFLIK